MQRRQAGAVNTLSFFGTVQHHAFAFGVNTVAGHVVQTQYNVLRRNDDWLAVRWGQDVVGGHHQRTRFQLGFQRQRYVNGHLVTIEVGVYAAQPAGAAGSLYLRSEPVQTPGYPNGAGLVHGSAVPGVRESLRPGYPNDGFFTLNHFLAALMVVARPRSSNLP